MIFSAAEFSFSKRQSPITLTDKGLKYYKDLDIESIINSNWPEWSKEIKDALSIYSKPSAYYVQKVCFEIFNNFEEKINEKNLEKIKSHAFSNGLDIILYDSLFQVPVRDKMLKNLELSVSDIDNHEHL